MKNPLRILNLKALPVVVLAVLAFAAAGASAQSDEVLTLDIKAQNAGSALLKLANSSGVQIMLSEGRGADVEVEELKGEYRFEEALAALLTDTGLEYEYASENVVLVQEVEQAAETEAVDEAPAEDEDDSPLELTKQTVTGSRLATGASQVSSRVIVLSNEDLRNSGAATLEQALRQLPQNVDGITEFGGAGLYRSDNSPRMLGSANIHGASTINLRGLGDAATLVLVDGKRVSESGILGGFVDISEFPISRIERVEIQLDGGSSVYGSDAIGGVINVILKKGGDYRQVTLRRKIEPRFVENNASAIFSMPIGNDTGSITFSFDAYQTPGQSLVRGADQTGLTMFFPVTGATGHVQNRRKGREISPALTRAAVGAGLIPMGEQVVLVPLPAGQDGAILTLDDFLNDSINTYGDVADSRPRVSIVPSSDRYVVGVSAQMAFRDWLNVAGGVRYNSRNTHHDNGDAWSNRNSLRYRVPADNPYNPFGTAVEVHRFAPDLGVTRSVAAERDGLMVDLDFDGTIGERWHWELRSRLSRQDEVGESSNIANGGRGGIADVALLDKGLNVFGNSLLTDGNNADILADAALLILPDQRTETNHRLITSELVIRGSVFSLPAGNVSVATGVEWRKLRRKIEYGTTHLRFLNVNSPLGPNGLTQGFTIEGEQLFRAAFAEVFVPVIGKRNRLPGIHDFGITLSGRHDATAGSSSAGSVTSSRYNSNVWSAGLAWRPIETVKIHAHKSSSFRAPELAQSLFPPIVTPRGFVFDLRSGFGFAYPSITRGGNPELGPEEGAALNVGIDFSPTLVEGLTISADYHQTNYTNHISAVNTLGILIVDQASFEKFRFQYTIDENDDIVAFDYRVANVAKRYVQGMDYSLEYVFGIGRNEFKLSASVAETQTFLEDVDATYDLTELEQYIGSRQPKYRRQASLSWQRGGWFVILNARKTSSISYLWTTIDEVYGSPVLVQATSKPASPVDLRVTYDTGNKWGFLRNVQFRLGVNNVFESFYKVAIDPESPYGHSGSPRGVNSARGRSYYLALSKEF